MPTEYNGWQNYETWNVALWIDNEEGSQRYWRAAAQQAYDEAKGDNQGSAAEDRAVGNLAQQLKSEIDEGNPLADQNSLYSDILSANLSEVNWREIAAHWIGDVDKRDPDDEDIDASDQSDEEHEAIGPEND